ncbi:MAG: NAD(P)-binding protein [Prevotella sp.]|nr:NAD(P)-binding protein [Prevotella sp.]
MKRIAIIGAGVSGLTTARLLTDSKRERREEEIVLFEKESKPGGLIRCERIGGSLFHTCGGHIFNTHDRQVHEWFWQHFNSEEEFLKADRNSVVFLPNGQHIPYPIENHAYMLNESLQRLFIHDLLQLDSASAHPASQPGNFEDFLLQRFGKTLYDLYFGPYNRKLWQCSLKDVPLDWLKGKLPMPTREEIIYNNFNRVAEKQFVHSTFFYEKHGGSQFIADRLAEGLDIRFNTDIKLIRHTGRQWILNGEVFDTVIFCGNIKDLPSLVQGVDVSAYTDFIDALSFHGTTTVFSEIDKTSYSWVYLPDESYRPHRIICTGNFSPTNDSGHIALSERNGNVQKTTATIEFTDYVSKEEILDGLKHTPLHPTYITHKYNRYSYPIQDKNTREMIASLKELLSAKGFYFTGRFADWEYYNMDAAMKAAMKTVERLC